GYRNTPFKAAESGNRHVQALIGPWVHKYPHFAWPKPRTDFLGEAIAWWNHWLRGEVNSVSELPQLRAFILDGPVAGGRRSEDPGFWVAKPVWNKPETDIYSADADGILQCAVTDAATYPVYIRSPLDTGTTSGEWFTLKPDAEMAGDQAIDDAKSYVLETAPFREARSYLGIPEVELAVSSKAPLANLVIRLVDVHPDGKATRISFGVLNLAHRKSDEYPQPMPAGEPVAIRMRLDACGYRLKEGHRLRIAISTAYWPMVLPDPYNAGITIDRSSLKLSLPLLGEHDIIDMKQPENDDPLPHYPVLHPAETRRTVERDLMSGRTNYNIYEDTGMSMHPDTGLAAGQTREEQWSIDPDNPLSMKGVCEWVTFMERDDWKLKTIAGAQMICTETTWIISGRLQAFEGEKMVFEKDYSAEIPRDHM
ncbi:MAG: CocE/NonD family hydrolase, partial [Brucellaceae bacterium]|nr:CocE/NonD family hydrolase [Brucellaceae bacterium]